MADLTVRERLLAALQARLSDAGVTILRAPQPVIAATSDLQTMFAPESETVREARNGVATRELAVRFTTFARGETGHLVGDERVARIHEQLMSGWPGVLVEEIGSDFDEDDAEESVWRVVVRYRFIYRTSVRTLGGRPEQVVMFSGGLDSLGGAIEEILTQKRRVVLVTHKSTPKLNNRHRNMETLLAAKAGDNAPHHISVRVHKTKGLNHEYTQRSRSFLYMSIGATHQIRRDALDRDLRPGLLSFSFAHAVDNKGACIFQLKVIATSGITRPVNFSNEIRQHKIGARRIDKEQLIELGGRESINK